MASQAWVDPLLKQGFLDPPIDPHWFLDGGGGQNVPKYLPHTPKTQQTTWLKNKLFVAAASFQIDSFVIVHVVALVVLVVIWNRVALRMRPISPQAVPIFAKLASNMT